MCSQACTLDARQRADRGAQLRRGRLRAAEIGARPASGTAVRRRACGRCEARLRFSASSSTANACATRSLCSGNNRSTISAPRSVIATLAARRSLASRRRCDELAALERRDDLGRVGLRRAQPRAQHAQLELAARRRQDDEHREAGRRQPLALEVGAQPAANGCLGSQQRLEGAMRERVAGHEGHPGAGP